MQWRIVFSCFCALLLFLCLIALPGEASKEEENTSGISSSLFAHLGWRNIGPANMCGRVADIEGVPGHPEIVFVGSASGGVWKTTNGGITWKPIFDDQPVSSIGDLALEPGNPDVIYVGTGESNVRNSVSIGNGIYKSTDGGQSWQHLGLEETEHISRIIIHPHNPDVLFVGALGHAFGPNEDRGVYMTRDGGKTWKKVLYVDEKHGVSDMDIDHNNPNVLYAGLWRFERKPWTFTSGSEQGGVYRSVDGGLTWKKLTHGLPRLIGRIGVKVSRSRSEIVYVIAESHEGTLFRSEDRGDTFRTVSKDRQIVSRGFYYTDLRVDPTDENRIYAVASRLFLSIDGGKNFEHISPTTHVDYHALWIDPEDPDRLWQGQDGGVAVSYDRGKSWEYVNNFPVGQFYQIYADEREPFYYVGGGLQDNGTWYGPSRNREPSGILNDDWRMISFGDGFFIVSHPEDPEVFITESQGGRIVRTDMATREQQDISPQARRADGGPASSVKYRFHWNSPIIPSSHNKKTIYVGGNVVFKSTDFGSTWQIISPDLTTDDPAKQKTAGGPAWTENSTAEFHCTIISLAESPVQKDLLWAGTDDGNLNISTDGGKSWTNVVNNVPGIPDHSPVSHIEPSTVSASWAYCAFDRHMLDDFRPLIFKTENYGKTWVNLTGNLPPKAYVWVIREDPKNPQILYTGTEQGLYVSQNAGQSWMKLHMKNLPPVAVHDILIHPRENDLILGTHGRSIWVFDDITVLQQIKPDLLQQPAYLFPVRPALRFSSQMTRYGIGDKVFKGPNPPYGALLTYYLAEKPDKNKKVKLEVIDRSGHVIRTIKLFLTHKGLNRTAWDLRLQPPRSRREGREQVDFYGRGPRGPLAVPGAYTIRLTIEDRTFEQPVEVRLDPTIDVPLEALDEQQEHTLKLRNMQSRVNDTLRALDMMAEQLKERRKIGMKKDAEFPKEALELIDEHLKKISALQDRMTRSEGARWTGSRLLGKLRSLFTTLDQVHAAPTEAQKEYFQSLVEDYNDSMGKFNKYISEEAIGLNSRLRQLNIPILVLPKTRESQE